MPTPVLPLFHSLLDSLRIPIRPPTLRSIPPSLLLLTLESILGRRFALPSGLRACSNPAEELGMVKCLLGILSDDILGVDLSSIDPRVIVTGPSTGSRTDRQLEALVMALVVVAKRQGIPCVAPRSIIKRTGVLLGESSMGEPLVSSTVGDFDPLPKPLEPDVTLSSPSSHSPGSRQPLSDTDTSFDEHRHEYAFGQQASGSRYSDDVFGSALQEVEYSVETSVSSYQDEDEKDEKLDITNEFDPYCQAYRHLILPLDTRPGPEEDGGSEPRHTNAPLARPSQQSLVAETSARTVLQCMLEEFGLDMG
ncbi:hypothetical protein IAU60_006793 [Kwoniella sp. DSM 27419]